MKRELEDELCQLSPTFFEELIDCSKGELTEVQSCMAWGCECDDGWYEPLKKLAQKMNVLNEILKKYDCEVVASQIKEKWGDLTIYYTTIAKEQIVPDCLMELVEDTINEATEEAGHYCEHCGNKEDRHNDVRIVTTRGWVKKICLNCAFEGKEQLNVDLSGTGITDFLSPTYKTSICFEGGSLLGGPEGKSVYYSSIWEAFLSWVFKYRYHYREEDHTKELLEEILRTHGKMTLQKPTGILLKDFQLTEETLGILQFTIVKAFWDDKQMLHDLLSTGNRKLELVLPGDWYGLSVVPDSQERSKYGLMLEEARRVLSDKKVTYKYLLDHWEEIGFGGADFGWNRFKLYKLSNTHVGEPTYQFVEVVPDGYEMLATSEDFEEVHKEMENYLKEERWKLK